MRADGRNDDGFDVGMNNWPARGKGISRRTCWCGHDEAVGAIPADEIGVDGEANFDHSRESAFVDDDFVEDTLVVKRFTVADEHGVKQHAFAGGKMAGKCFFKRGIKLLQSKTR